jgi:hypothetical protein
VKAHLWRFCRLLYLYLLGAGVLVVTHLHPASATTLQLVAQGRALRGASITVTPRVGKPGFAGLVGDFFEIGDGEYRITLSAEAQGIPELLTLEFTARVMGQHIEILGSSHPTPSCWYGPRGAYKPVVAWPAPIVRPRKEGAGRVIALDLSDPKYGAPIDLPGCPSLAMAACTTQKAIVTVKSVPPAAEIWIDGVSADLKTDATLSVPYCHGGESKDILLRFPNAVNCERTITLATTLAPEAKLTVTCMLEQFR